MNIKVANAEGKTIVAVDGRIDTTNVTEFEKQMAELTDPSTAIEMECSELDYISSSGLRIFLSMQKKVGAAGGSLVLRNMRPEIREIFDMTGFSSIFTIE